MWQRNQLQVPCKNTFFSFKLTRNHGFDLPIWVLTATLLHLRRYEGVSRSRYLRRLRHRRWCAQFELQPQPGCWMARENPPKWVEKTSKNSQTWCCGQIYSTSGDFLQQNIWMVVGFILQFQCSHRYLSQRWRMVRYPRTFGYVLKWNDTAQNSTSHEGCRKQQNSETCNELSPDFWGATHGRST